MTTQIMFPSGSPPFPIIFRRETATDNVKNTYRYCRCQNYGCIEQITIYFEKKLGTNSGKSISPHGSRLGGESLSHYDIRGPGNHPVRRFCGHVVF